MEGLTILNVRHASRVAAVSSADGPRRILEAGLVEALEEEGAPVEVVELPAPSRVASEVAAAFAVAGDVERAARQAASRERLALVLSGSCHTSVGSVAGIPGRRRGVVWLDCHGDFNTPETTGSGLLDGTALASITGRCWRRMCSGVEGFAPVPDERVIAFGVRDLDPGEDELLEESGITVISAEEATTKAPAALRRLGEDTDGVYVHLDLDVLDPSAGRANEYARAGGFSPEGLGTLLQAVVDHCPVRAVGFTSYDPSVDPEGAVARTAVGLARVIWTRMRSTAESAGSATALRPPGRS